MISTYLEFLKDEWFENLTSEPYNLPIKIKAPYGSKLHVDQESKKQGTYISMAKDALNNNIQNVDSLGVLHSAHIEENLIGF